MRFGGPDTGVVRRELRPIPGRRKMMPNGSVTISEAVSRFYRTKKISQLFAVSRLILQKRRLLEASYGVLCFLVKKPSSVYGDMKLDIVKALETVKILFAEMHAQKGKILLEASSKLNSTESLLNFTIHGFIITKNGFVIGEYAENSSRIFVNNNGRYITHQFYGSDSGVRHIHSILQYDGYAFISTGDSNKYLDKYRIVNGDLSFDSRVLRHLGGFSACCVVDGMCFFGSDFSERPNYIFFLEKRRKFFFPCPAYTQFCALMLSFHNRYIFCLNRSILIPNRKTISIFDTKRSTFVYCKEYSGNEYE